MSSHIRTDYVFFNTINFTGNVTTSGYALDICPFKFVPRLGNNNTNLYSNDRILWDFGDGTTSRALCAEHSYLFPGKYEVTLYVYNSSGEGIYSTFKETITVKNFVTDTLTLSSKSSYIQESGDVGHADGITIIRYNSWQSYKTLSAEGYSIFLYASGNDEFFDLDDYNSKKYSHLDTSHKFYTREFNTVTGKNDYTPVDRVQTSNTLLYARISGSNLMLCKEGDPGSSFVGTYGTKTVYFVGEKICNGFSYRERQPVILTFGFDTSKFDDNISFLKDYYNTLDRPEYPYLNIITENAGVLIFPQTSVNKLSFTSNGIDGIGERYTGFKINPTQYACTKIPFVVRVKNEYEYPTKYIPLLSAVSAVSIPYEIKISILSGNNVLLDSNSVTAVQDTSNQPDDSGGYWKGYLFFSQPVSSVFLSAASLVEQPETYLKYPTPLAFIANPNTETLSRTNIYLEYNYCSDDVLSVRINGSGALLDTSTNSLSNQMAICVVPESLSANGSYYSVWVADSVADVITKYDTYGAILSTVDLKAATLSGGSIVPLTGNDTGAAPSYMAADSNQNIWVTLHDAVSTIKINSSTGRIDYVAYPNLTNISYILASNYNTSALSGFVGSNSLLPTAVDTDRNDSIWVTYSHPLSNFLIKYNSSGVLLSSIPLSGGYAPVDIVVNYDNNVWAVLQQNFATSDTLTGYRDLIIYHNDQSGSTTVVYGASGRLGNITIDLSGNVYATHNKADVVRIDGSSFAANVINLPTSVNNVSQYMSDLEGIASTASRDIIVINNTQSVLMAIDSVSGTYNGHTAPILRGTINDVLSEENTLMATGDFTGFRWVYKYGRVFPSTNAVSGVSDVFNVYEFEDRYQFGKFGENFDATQLYKDLRYQEALRDDDIMFNDFIGTIVGNISSSPNTLGKRVYEKASNFVSNIVDPDTCNVDALYNLYKLHDLDIEKFDQARFTAPSNLGRLIDLLSIKQSKLWGSRNKFDKDFDVNGYCPGANLYYGLNLGEQLSVESAILTAGDNSTPIVAYEIFSDSYKYINTDVLSSKYINFRDVGAQTYELSAYTKGWGWGLTLPEGEEGINIKNYYVFYNYVNRYDNTQVEGVINWGDVINNLSEGASARNTWIGNNQIVENILSYALYDGLSLFSCANSGLS